MKVLFMLMLTVFTFTLSTQKAVAASFTKPVTVVVKKNVAKKNLKAVAILPTNGQIAEAPRFWFQWIVGLVTTIIGIITVDPILVALGEWNMLLADELDPNGNPPTP